MLYISLKKYMGEHVELCPVELAGRGSRFDEPLYSDMKEAAEDLYEAVQKIILSDQDYAFLGYSMGALIVYEVLKKIKENGLKEPVHLFMAAKEPPNVADTEYDQKLYTLPDDIFRKVIGELGGTPKEILECEDAVNYFLPILRADYKIVDTYPIETEPMDLKCDMTVMGGNEDTFTSAYIGGWKAYTSKEYEQIMFEGGHFFINEHGEEFAWIISQKLDKYI